jgi:sulfhydrogenase subunit beta (sulfur reductase)
VIDSIIKKDHLDIIFDKLKGRFRVIGPKVEDGTIVLSEIEFSDIPTGYRDRQERGVYRLEEGVTHEVFSFSVGPQSFKTFLSPSVQEVFSFGKLKKGIVTEEVIRKDKPLAFVGVRACDLAALKLLDKVFLEGPVVDKKYRDRRKNIFVVAVNCIYPGGNCFCDSMGTGPGVSEGFDIVLTELAEYFLVEAGSDEGEKIFSDFGSIGADDSCHREKDALISRCRGMMGKSMKTGDLPDVIYRNMGHPRWQEIAEKDLECGNCTMVCPTCFCNSAYDTVPVSAISGNALEFSGVRTRKWDSCFSHNFARVHGGNFRPSRKARYRHWMTHKLAYWIDQFGSPGCVGCGRCITWCPVGIDITRELQELRRVR